MVRAKQLSVSMENKPGRLAHVCRCLAERKINILALSVAETTEQSLVRLVVDKPDEAATMLKECPLTFTETDVRLMELPNKPGALAELAEKLAAKRVNLNFIYGSAGKAGAKAVLVIGASRLAAADRAVAAR